MATLDFGTQRIGFLGEYEAVIHDGAGATIDLTGATIEATLRNSRSGASLATLTTTVLNAKGGAIKITVDEADIASLSPGQYLIGLDITDATSRHIDGTGGDDWYLTLIGGVGTESAASAAYTVSKATARLVRKRRKWLAAVGMDTSTGAGNEDAADALIGAMEWLEIGLDDPGRVSDDDLASVTAYQWAALIDIGDLKLMEAILGNADEVTSSDNQRKKSASDFALWVQGTIDAKLAELKIKYGYGLASLTAGSIDLGFQATSDCGEF